MASSESPVSYVWDTGKFDEALKMACYFFQIERFHDDQEKALMNYFKNRSNLFYSAPTGHGKSLVFQAIPLIADVLSDNNIGASNILVISPLTSLMHDQVEFLNKKTGVSGAAIFENQDEQILQDIEDGIYSVVYASPESMLSGARWRKMLSASTFSEYCVGVVFDEAHCIRQWGLSNSKKVPFRRWYGFLGEIRSLLPRSVQLSVFTATATKLTKLTIFDVLGLDTFNTFMIEKSPMKANLKFTVEYLSNDKGLDEVFHKLIREIKENYQDTIRTIIFCQTRTQVALIWKMFEVNLGKKFYANEKQSCYERIVEMFHAGTAASVKDHIVKQLSSAGSHLRVLVCTIAVGMGINCKDVNRVVHFGPSKSVESYLQECGRGGRDGSESHNFLLYNGFMLSKCENDIKELVYTEKCRRETILKLFPNRSTDEKLHGCNCCDNCVKACTCNDCKKGKFKFLPVEEQEKSIDMPARVREVSKEQVVNLQTRLIEYKDSIFEHQMHRGVGEVSHPNVILQFSDFQIKQICQNCAKLFTLDDLQKYVELWRKKDSKQVLNIISQIFQDILPDEDDLPGSQDTTLVDNDDLVSEWGEIRDDSEICSLDISGNHHLDETYEGTIDTLQSEANTNYNDDLEKYMDLSGIQVLVDESMHTE